MLHLIYKVQYDRLYSARHLVADDRLVQSVFRNERAGRGVLRLDKLRGRERKRYDPAWHDLVGDPPSLQRRRERRRRQVQCVSH